MPRTPAAAAAYWIVRRDSETFSAPEQRAFDAWLAASSEHRAAFQRSAAMLDLFDAPDVADSLTAMRAAARSAKPMRRHWAAAAAAAAVVLCVSLPLLVVKLYSFPPPSAPTAIASTAAPLHLTTQSQPNSVTLSDGSTVWLSIDTALDVAFRDAERSVRILRGEAFFDVAKNPQRPFRVAAADRRVTALGTQFNVRLDEQRVEVVLLEGRVSVEQPALRTPAVELHPNQRLLAAAGRESVADVNARSLTSWRQGWIVFDNATVADALLQFNRYSPHAVVADDPQIRAMRLSGVFRAAQPARFAATIQEFLPIVAVQDAQGNTKLVAGPH